MPIKGEISDIASAYGRKLEEATKAKTAHRGAEAIADEIAATYPFHPRLKNEVALFKENELLKSVWDRRLLGRPQPTAIASGVIVAHRVLSTAVMR